MLEIIFNRWRGTGLIFYKVNGNILYAVYWFLLLFCITNNILYGVIFCGLYLLGESYSWGKWVSYLCFPENHEKEFENKTGKSFPFIHFTANFIIDQKKDYLNYCRLALALRGFYWFFPMILFLFLISLIDIYQLLFSTILLSFGFPLAAELSRFYNPKLNFKFLICENNWETQECIYGFFHFLGITLMLFI